MQCLLLTMSVLLSITAWAWAGNLHGEPDALRELRSTMGDFGDGFVTSGCVPTVPSASLTIQGFACKAYVKDTHELIYVDQASQAVGPLNSGNGLYWLAVHRDETGTVSGWTRQARSHYLWQKSAAYPVNPTGGLVIGRVLVSGGVITEVVRLALANPTRTRRTIDVEDFRTCEGTGCDSQAIAAALTYLVVRGVGGQLDFSRATYNLTAEVLVPFTGISQQRGIMLMGRAPGGTRLHATQDGMTILHWAHSFGGAQNFILHGNGHTGVSCLRVSPENESQTTTVVHQQHNVFRDITSYACAEGLVLRPGPVVSGAAGGAWDNEFYNYRAFFCLRGIYLASGPDVGVQGAGNHRNKWYGGKITQGVNVGIHIRHGGENRFYGQMIENVTTGTSPIATPTAIYIENNDGATAPVTNYDNAIIGGGGENWTRLLNNGGIGTQLVGWPSNNGNVENAGSVPLAIVMTGGNNANQRWADMVYAPLAEAGLLQNAYNWKKHHGLLPQPYDGVAGHQIAHMFDQRTAGTAGGAWHLYTPTRGDVTNVAGGTFTQANGGVWQFSGRVTWDFRGQFQAATAGTAITIRLPIAPDDTQYTTVVAGLAAWQYNVVVKGATSGIVAAIGQLTGSGRNTFLSIPAPSGNWDTSGAHNSIWLRIEYTAPQYILP
jgi:hypothetical protein